MILSWSWWSTLQSSYSPEKINGWNLKKAPKGKGKPSINYKLDKPSVLGFQPLVFGGFHNKIWEQDPSNNLFLKLPDSRFLPCHGTRVVADQCTLQASLWDRCQQPNCFGPPQKKEATNDGKALQGLRKFWCIIKMASPLKLKIWHQIWKQLLFHSFILCSYFENITWTSPNHNEETPIQ